MEITSLKKSAFLALLGIIFTAALLVTSTYAWFTNNAKVETGTASGRSGTAEMALLIGPDEGSLSDSSTDDVEIGMVNSADISKMQPVSTADLNTFLYCISMQGGKASRFKEDTDEKNFYHGRLYMKMQGDALTDSDRFKIYFDSAESAGGSIAAADSGDFLSAARLGIKVSEKDPVIIKFEDGGAKTEDNTRIGGTDIGSGYVLDASGSPVTDPAEEISVYTLNSEEIPVTLPEKELTVISGNETVQMDIYFYLEGCDSNCISDISLNEARFHLAFYAVAE